jgi:phosphoribosylformylglycinamidine synthase subunit PurQ / glutaminase
VSAPRPRVCVITGFGINADDELAVAFEMAGGDPRRVHVTDLIAEPSLLHQFRILAFPGGFSYGDHLGSGKVFATLFRRNLGAGMAAFVAAGGLVIGICNGFQVLVKMGVLPNLSVTSGQEVSLIHNDSGKYEDRWVRVRFEEGSRCVWTRGLRQMDLPVRHGEGRFVTRSAELMSELSARGLVALRYSSASGREPEYPEDPNGSEGHVAGICDPTGRVFGLMPHPEAFIHAQNHPDWSARPLMEGEGLRIFVNGIKAAS